MGIKNTSMQPPRLGILIYSAVISAVSLATIWIGLHVAAPKVIGWFQDLNEQMVLPDFAQWTIQCSRLAVELFWPATLIVVTLSVLGLFSRLPKQLVGLARISMVAVSLALTIFNALLYVSVFIAAHEVYHIQAHKLQTYSGVLEGFALLEAADNRWDETQKRMAALANIAQKRLESADELSRQARSARVSQVVRLAKEAQSPELQKRILATLSMFREDLPRYKHNELTVLALAGERTGQRFTTSKDFFIWLDQNDGKDGWEPVPLYTFKTKK